MVKLTSDRRRRNMKVDVYKALKDAIQFLELKPGSRINEVDLASELGVSRTPVREAILRLGDELLINIYPQSGIYVSKMDMSLIKELAYMRNILETDVFLNLCNEKARIGNVLEEIMHTMEYAVKKKEISGYVKCDDDFHRAIFTYAKHEMMWNIISSTRVHYVRYLMLENQFIDMLEESFQQHQRIIECIENGDEVGLIETLKRHHYQNEMKMEEQIKEIYNDYFD